MKFLYTFKLLFLCLCFSFSACAQPNKTRTFTDESGTKEKFKYVLHKANTRGETTVSWLLAKHSFSFNDYYEPDRMNFGALRVLNDDRINPGGSFPTHPHENMEIITIPLQGAIHHKDNMGNSGVIKAGDVQMMSAGTGIRHSEANASATDTLKLLQIWVLPNKRNVKPRYQQINGILNSIPQNTFKKLVAPNDTNVIFLYQDAVFSMGNFDKGKKSEYNMAFEGNGVYAFILEGSAEINGIKVNRRDGIGIWNTKNLTIEATDNLQILLMDVPMLE